VINRASQSCPASPAPFDGNQTRSTEYLRLTIDYGIAGDKVDVGRIRGCTPWNRDEAGGTLKALLRYASQGSQITVTSEQAEGTVCWYWRRLATSKASAAGGARSYRISYSNRAVIAMKAPKLVLAAT